jgi:hypothetical protein
MAATALKRLELKVPKEGDERVQLAEKAYNLLGYRGLIKSGNVCGPLGLALAKLEIKPYDPSRVDKYKKEKAKAARKEAHERKRSSWERVTCIWKNVPLVGYKSYVPEFALRKAIQIAEAAPEAVFKVEELVVQRHRVDPFLTVEMKGEKYWIEVWNEDEFETAVIDGK